ncbi:DNA-directed RNA polymerase II core subunit [Elasticomyces elasticus]|nr:DNA-directed RNA polymerase II core subunit [Elasticomyces elasticus]KAK3627061.1 DNA-directed RNA polymerase II core subunit [Elasticomyces elasticus]KAK4907483.1 DNA-directed RNA polymerase II core subunit [Elasticomyces elasticus]KAK5689146.1 DNA-directed RNA polymerase II core subunit [Elasticomyces elasticus]KAK5747871.1 DNA-directed RNA polymerase II core subunit [Elasticomyces elasticus]
MARDQEKNDSAEPKKLGGRLPAYNGSYSSGYSGVLDPRIGGAVGSKLEVDTQPDRYELFLLGEGEKKVTLEVETRVPNAALFTFNKEDHTLGNLLRDKLTRSDHVLFAAYQVPHPLFAVFKLRVQTDGEVTPKQAVVGACQELVQELQTLDQEFTKEWELKKIAGERDY